MALCFVFTMRGTTPMNKKITLLFCLLALLGTTASPLFCAGDRGSENSQIYPPDNNAHQKNQTTSSTKRKRRKSVTLTTIGLAIAVVGVTIHYRGSKNIPEIIKDSFDGVVGLIGAMRVRGNSLRKRFLKRKIKQKK